MVIFSWFSIAYPCYLMGSLLTKNSKSFESRIFRILFSSIILTGADICGESVYSSPGGHKIWNYSDLTKIPQEILNKRNWQWNALEEDKVLGAPLVNYRGWFITGLVMFLLIELFANKIVYDISETIQKRRSIDVLSVIFPIIVFMCIGSFYSMHPLHLKEIQLMGWFLMVFPAILSLTTISSTEKVKKD